MVPLYRTTLVHLDGSFISDALTRRNPEYDRLRQSTAGLWFAIRPNLRRYAGYRAAVIAERRLHRSPAAIAASASREFAAELKAAVADRRSASARVDRAAAALARVHDAGFPAPRSIDALRAVVAAVHEFSLDVRAATAAITSVSRRSGSLARWFMPIPGVDVLSLTDGFTERAAVIIDDLVATRWHCERVARTHQMPVGVLRQILRGIDPARRGWREHAAWLVREAVAAHGPPLPAGPDVYALRLEVLVTDTLAQRSLAINQAPALRDLAPSADQHLECLLPRAEAAAARLVAAERINLSNHSLNADIAIKVALAGHDAASLPFAGWRRSSP